MCGTKVCTQLWVGFKLTEQVRDKWVKAEGQTLRMRDIETSHRSPASVGLSGDQGRHQWRSIKRFGEELEYTCTTIPASPVFCNPQAGSFRAWGRVLPWGPCGFQQSLRLLASDWPRLGKPVIALFLGRKRLRDLLFCLGWACLYAPSVCICSRDFCLDVNLTTDNKFFYTLTQLVFSDPNLSVVFDQDHHHILSILGWGHLAWHRIFFSILPRLVHKWTFCLHL